MLARGLIQSPVLVGRDAFLTLTEDRLADAAAGAGRVLLVAGEAGIGRSRKPFSFAEAVELDRDDRGGALAGGLGELSVEREWWSLPRGPGVRRRYSGPGLRRGAGWRSSAGFPSASCGCPPGSLHTKHTWLTHGRHVGGVS